jgi:hypothetical protein
MAPSIFTKLQEDQGAAQRKAILGAGHPNVAPPTKCSADATNKGQCNWLNGFLVPSRDARDCRYRFLEDFNALAGELGTKKPESFPIAPGSGQVPLGELGFSTGQLRQVCLSSNTSALDLNQTNIKQTSNKQKEN